MAKILKHVDVVVVFPDGREIKGRSYHYPENAKASLYQIFDANGNDSFLANLQLAESISLKPTFEGE